MYTLSVSASVVEVVDYIKDLNESVNDVRHSVVPIRPKRFVNVTIDAYKQKGEQMLQ